MLRFSIIIPAHNVALYLNDCLQSIMEQSFIDWEAIVVDDGSNDATCNIAKEWVSRDQRIQLISTIHQGQAVARNVAMDVANGEYVVFLDADDIFPDEEFLMRANDWIAHESLPDVIALNVQHLHLCNNQWERRLDEVYSHPSMKVFNTGKEYLNYFVILKKWGPTGIFYIVKKSLITANNLHFSAGIFHEDSLFIPIVCYFAQKVVVATNLMYCYRMREDSTMATRGKKNVEDMRFVANALADFFKEQHYVNAVSKSIVFNNAILGHDYQLAWRNASIKRKVKLILGWYKNN